MRVFPEGFMHNIPFGEWRSKMKKRIGYFFAILGIIAVGYIIHVVTTNESEHNLNAAEINGVIATSTTW